MEDLRTFALVSGKQTALPTDPPSYPHGREREWSFNIGEALSELHAWEGSDSNS